MRVIKLVTLMILLMVASISGMAQGKFRFVAAYEDSRIPLTEKDRDEDAVKGYSAEADVQVFKLGKVRGSAAYLFEQRNDVEVYPNYFDGTKIVNLYRNVTTHYGGAQLGLDIGHAVEPFIGYFVGTNKVHEVANRQIVSKVRIGANVTFTKKSRIFAKAAIDFNRSYGSPNKETPVPEPVPAAVAGGFISPDNRMVIVGIGLRF